MQVIKSTETIVEGFKAEVDGRLEEFQFSIGRRIKIQDLRQNFQKLNSILLVKFRQLEQTKQATRNLIAY